MVGNHHAIVFNALQVTDNLFFLVVLSWCENDAQRGKMGSLYYYTMFLYYIIKAVNKSSYPQPPFPLQVPHTGELWPSIKTFLTRRA